MGVALNATTATTTFLENTTTTSTPPTTTTNCLFIDPVLSERERIKMEFYQTYDVMTGIRIAATLGSFFTMMVLLVLYKSKCKSRADESLEAAITAAVAEEEELEAVLNQSNYDFEFSRPRQSLGSMSTPAYTRFSSLGGYGSLMNPPKRYDRGSRGRVSLPTPDLSFRYVTSAPTSFGSQERSPRTWRSYDEEEENDLREVEEIDDLDDPRYLQVPCSRFKYSSSSLADSSLYIEDRSFRPRDEYLSLERETELRHKYNHPNIHVIQATPQISPSESSSGLQEDHFMRRDNQKHSFDCKLAPLASFGSCSALSSMESENRSIGSDSVFVNASLIEEDDTDKDQSEELLSTRSEHQDCTNKKYRIVPTPCTSKSCFVISDNYIRNRRFSDFGLLDKNSRNRILPIVSNLVASTSNQIETSVYNQKISTDSLDSSTSLSSNFSEFSATSSERRRAIISRIAIIDVNDYESPTKTDNSKQIKIKNKSSLSKSEPQTMNVSSNDPTTRELKTLSLKNLMENPTWSKETLF